MELYQIVLLVVAGIIAVLYFVQKFTGINYLQRIIQCKPVQLAVTGLVKAMAAIMPNEYVNVVIVVLEAASKGTKAAEELWKLGELPKEERNAYAKKMTAGVLTEAGIEVTPQIQMIIDGAIEMICMILPHEKK